MQHIFKKCLFLYISAEIEGIVNTINSQIMENGDFLHEEISVKQLI